MDQVYTITVDNSVGQSAHRAGDQGTCHHEKRQVRSVKFVEIQGANYFLSASFHWSLLCMINRDGPQKFWEVNVNKRARSEDSNFIPL